jgi:hypothetical protein
VKSTLVSGTVKKVAGSVVTIGSTEVTFGSGVNMADIAKDKVVSAWIYDGKAYKAIVHAEAKTNVIASKGTDTTGSYVTFVQDTDKVYLAKNATITLNGAAATFANLAAGQYAVYELVDDKIAKLDAYSKTVEGKVDSWKSAGGYYTYITIDGVEYKVAANAVSASESIMIGANVVLTLNTQNEVLAVKQLTEYASVVIGDFDSLYAQATAVGTKYFVTLKDGISYDISDAVTGNKVDDYKLYINLDTTKEKEDEPSEKEPFGFNDLNVKDSTFKIQYNAAGKVIRVDVFANPFETKDKGVAMSKAKAGFTTYTKDGVGCYDLVDNAAKYVVTWDVAVGFAKNINAVTVEPKESKVTGKGTDLRGNYIIIESTDQEDNGTYHLSTALSSIFDEIQIGDTVTFSLAKDAWGNDYITEIEITIKAAPGETPSLPDTTYTVTYINSTVTRVVIDHTITLIFDSDTEIKDEDGHIIAVGYEDIIELDALAVNDVVKDIVIVDGVVASLVKVTAAP